jgi:6-phosphogluconolactonase
MTMRHVPGYLLILAAVLAAASGAGERDSPQRSHPSADGVLVLVGTYTGARSEGVSAFRFDPATGALTPRGLAARSKNPSFLALHPNKRWVYAVNETEDGPGRSGTITAFALAANGTLTAINEQPSRGGGPCHLAIDAGGRFVFVANYTGGSIAMLPIETDGRLGPATAVMQHKGSSVNPKRQEGPHAHDVVVTGDDRFVLAVDLGLDRVAVYRLDGPHKTLTAHVPAFASVTPGAGPRHAAFDRTGRHLYVINELTNTISTFDWNATRGVLTPVQEVSTLPDKVTITSNTAEIQVHPSGRFLYGSNRGHDSLALFSIDPGTGRLTASGHTPTGGRSPRHFAIDPSGKWVIAANQKSDSLVVFAIDAATGRLTPTGAPATVGSPVCVLFVPDAS